MKRMFTAMNHSASASHCAEAAFACAFSGCCGAEASHIAVILDTMIVVSIFVMLVLPLSRLMASILAVAALILVQQEGPAPKEHPDFV